MKKLLLILTITYAICFSIGKYYTRIQDSVMGFWGNSFKEEIKSDIDYKRKILKDSNLPNLTFEEISSIVGPYELIEFIEKNNENPEIYNPKSKTFQANFHSHTVVSDGSLEPKELLDLAEKYAKKIAPKKFYLAITDHNKTRSGKEILQILDNNSNEYKNVKIVLGMEIFSFFEPKSKITKSQIPIHITALAINPFDKELNKVFEEKNQNDKYNFSYRTFENAIILLNKKGLVGIAHPARYINDSNAPDYQKYYDYLYKKYKYLTRKSFSYTEAYYQSYKEESPKTIEYIKDLCSKQNINKLGSIDNHGKSFYVK